MCVQASTLGSLEALLEFLRSQKEPIPVSSIAIGPIHRKDVMRAKVMLEKVCTCPSAWAVATLAPPCCPSLLP